MVAYLVEVLADAVSAVLGLRAVLSAGNGAVEDIAEFAVNEGDREASVNGSSSGLGDDGSNTSRDDSHEARDEREEGTSDANDELTNGAAKVSHERSKSVTSRAGEAVESRVH